MPAQLSVEDNELTSLAGIEPLVNLMELYAGGVSLQVTSYVWQLGAGCQKRVVVIWVSSVQAELRADAGS